MGGLLILFLGALYIWVAFKVVSLVKPNWARALLILVFVLIPTADAIYGRIRLQHMCTAEGGLKIDRVVEGVEGFYAERADDYDDWLTKYGYKFVEGEGNGQGVVRKTIGANGKISKVEDTVQRSQFRLSQENTSSGIGLYKHRMVVTSINSDAEIGSFTYFGYEGGWVERSIAKLYAGSGFGGDCGPFNSFDKKVEVVTMSLRQSK